jgi:hypothetical protein
MEELRFPEFDSERKGGEKHLISQRSTNATVMYG